MTRPLSALLIVSLFAAGCASNPNQTGDNENDKTVAGALIGAVAGAILGNNMGKQSTEKTLLAAAAGAAAGGMIGHSMDEKERQLKRIADERDDKEMEVERLRDNLLRVSLSSEASFAFGKSALRAEFKPTLDKVARVLIDEPNIAIKIVGHTDSIGSDSYNQLLSEHRANATADYLTSRGVSAAQIEAVGAGEREPRADNSTEAGRAQNRRVEIYLIGSR